MNLWHILYKPPEQSPTGQSAALHTAPRKLAQAPSPLKNVPCLWNDIRAWLPLLQPHLPSVTGCKTLSHLWAFAHAMKVKVSATQLCLTRCDPMDCSPPGSSVHGILQARILGWVATSSSRGSSLDSPTQGMNPGLAHCRQILDH